MALAIGWSRNDGVALTANHDSDFIWIALAMSRPPGGATSESRYTSHKWCHLIENCFCKLRGVL